jgi:hypothetical protein
MSKSAKTECKKPPVAIGSRQVVETAIDAAKASQTQTWESAAKQSNVPPWTRGTDKNCHNNNQDQE